MSLFPNAVSLYRNSILVIFLLVLPALSVAEESTEAMVQSMCFSCHAVEGKPTVAPPMFAVKHHVMSVHPSEEAFVAYVTQWVKSPSATSSLMPGAVRRFGVMPALAYSDQDLKKIASYIYKKDFSKPRWFDEHFRKEHGEKKD